MTKTDLAKTPHLTRWFTALASLTQCQQVWGNFKWCSAVSKPAFAEKKSDNKKSEPKEKKEKVEKKKEEKKEGPSKEDKDKLKMELAEKALAEHNEKIKVWLEAPSSFDFEEFKRE